MTPRAARSLAAVLCVLLLPSPAAPQARSRESDLAAIRRQIAQLEERLAGARRRATTLAGRLETVEVELALQDRRLAEARSARDLAAAEIERRTADVERLTGELAAARDALSRRLAGLYRLGRGGYLRLFFAVEPESDLLAAVRWLRYLIQRDARSIERYAAARERLEEERILLRQRHEEAERWAAQEEERRRYLATLERRHRLLLAESEEERRRLAARADELAAQERRLRQLIDSLAGSEEILRGRPVTDFEGVLDWPLAGRVVTGFGPRRDPRYQTEIPHNGIEIATDAGTRVRPVYPGEVLFAAPFEGYGPTVVVHHPGRVFTLYAGLAELSVETRDVVTLDDFLGRAGERLYFEIRVGNRPRDPLHWLRSLPP